MTTDPHAALAPRSEGVGQRAGAVSLAPATLDDMSGLVALNAQPDSSRSRRAGRAFHEQKLLAYLESPHALLAVAKCGRETVGYVAVVLNPAFAAGMRKPSRLLKQVMMICTGRYGFGIGRARWLARRAYERLWRDQRIQRQLTGTDHTRLAAWVNNIVVAEPRRGQGIAGQLLASAEAWARTKGAAAIGADVLVNNTASLRAFLKAGYLRVEGSTASNDARVQVLGKRLAP